MGLSFLQKILDSFINKGDPEAEKKRQLKAIAKELSKARYKFYKVNGEQVLPSFGKFFFDLYKAVSNAQTIFNLQQNPNFYKNMVIDYSLSENQQKLLEELTEESIKTQSSSMSFDQLKNKVKNELDAFTGEFDQAKIQMIDALYQKLMAFKSFCTYDYYFMMKKFDSSIHENDFSKAPKFTPIDASYISDDLKDFLSVAWALPASEDWADLMQMFKTVRGSEPIKLAQWQKITARLTQLRSSKVFEMIIQLTTKNPSYEVLIDEKQEQIIETYLDKIKNDATSTVRKLECEQKNSKIDSLVTQIFNTNSISILKYYTDAGSATFQKKNFEGFVYAKALNYMKAFLVEFVKREVREYADLVLIRGKWSTSPLSSQMSDAYNSMLEISEHITVFDSKVSEEGGEYGTKLKTLMPRAERDKESANIIRTILKDINSIAREYLIKVTKDLITFAKNTKVLIEDYQKPHGEMIINWKELDRFAEHPIKELGVEVYKKIYLMVNLMQGMIQ